MKTTTTSCAIVPTSIVNFRVLKRITECGPAIHLLVAVAHAVGRPQDAELVQDGCPSHPGVQPSLAQLETALRVIGEWPIEEGLRAVLVAEVEARRPAAEAKAAEARRRAEERERAAKRAEAVRRAIAERLGAPDWSHAAALLNRFLPGFEHVVEDRVGYIDEHIATAEERRAMKRALGADEDTPAALQLAIDQRRGRGTTAVTTSRLMRLEICLWDRRQARGPMMFEEV